MSTRCPYSTKINWTFSTPVGDQLHQRQMPHILLICSHCLSTCCGLLTQFSEDVVRGCNGSDKGHVHKGSLLSESETLNFNGRKNCTLTNYYCVFRELTKVMWTIAS